MSQYEKIIYESDGSLARVTLNRPEKRNALDGQMIDELKEAFREASRDESVKLVLMKGSGKDFCSGADLEALRRMREATVEENLDDARSLAELFIIMRRHTKPIVAAVSGRALAGGCGIATACDIVLAAESAQFGYPEVNVGFIPAMVMAILRRSVSEKRAFELITRGEILTAEAAREVGIVNRVFGDDQFDSAVQLYVSELSGKSASAVSLAKQLLYHMDAMSFESALEAGVQLNAVTRMTEDCKRGIDRFLKKE